MKHMINTSGSLKHMISGKLPSKQTELLSPPALHSHVVTYTVV